MHLARSGGAAPWCGLEVRGPSQERGWASHVFPAQPARRGHQMFGPSWIRPAAAGVVLACAVALAGCGTNPGDRAVSGGLLGAGTGAAIGAAAGNPGAGALIGGLSGAAIGGLTSPSQLNLGRPIWRHGDPRTAHRGYCTTHTSRSYGETTRTTVCHRRVA